MTQPDAHDISLNEYQQAAQETDRAPSGAESDLAIPLLGLAGEVGTLLSAHKKYLRDGEAFQVYNEQVAEDLGDILWYTANLATKFGLALNDIASFNLKKTRGRFLSSTSDPRRFFDESFPVKQRLPRWFEVEYDSQLDEKGRRRIAATCDGKQVGDFLTDNAHVDDGYRFHDAFHFGFATILGWSPVTRRNLRCKRKNDPKIDEVEDGARAIIYEEVIVALAYEHAARHNFLDGIDALDFPLLKTIKALTENLEVSIRTPKEWEIAILASFEIWRQLRANNGGRVSYDLENRRMEYLGPLDGRPVH